MEDQQRSLGDQQAGFVTPRSAMGSRSSGQNNWLGAMEMPRWMTRLGSYLSVANQGISPSELVPSEWGLTCASCCGNRRC